MISLKKYFLLKHFATKIMGKSLLTNLNKKSFPDLTVLW